MRFMKAYRDPHGCSVAVFRTKLHGKLISYTKEQLIRKIEEQGDNNYLSERQALLTIYKMEMNRKWNICRKCTGLVLLAMLVFILVKGIIS